MADIFRMDGEWNAIAHLSLKQFILEYVRPKGKNNQTLLKIDHENQHNVVVIAKQKTNNNHIRNSSQPQFRFIFALTFW